MTAEMGCEQVRELAPELALDIAVGEERDGAMRHLARCSDCRELVSELTSVGEDVLLLAPPREPPAGFRARVLGAISPPTASPVRELRPRRRRWLTATALAAAVVLSAALGGGSALIATAGDRRLAESYRTVLSEGEGSFFAAAALEGPDGRVGTVFGYEGRPSWVMVLVPPRGIEQGTFEARAVTRDGRYLTLGEAVLGGDSQGWGQPIPVRLSEVREIQLLRPDGGTAFTARFGAASPWD